MNKTTLGVFALAAWMVAATVYGQTGDIIPIKTPPLRDSDIYTFPISRHFDPNRPPGEPPPELPGAGWAGARVKIHVQDPTEVDIDALVAAPGYLIRYPGSPHPVGPPAGIYPVVPDPFGPRSNNVGSVPLIVTLIHPFANQSGINPPASHVEDLMNVVLHAKNTNLRGNSDIDVTFMFSDVWHTRSDPGSHIIHFPESVRIWSHSNVNDDPSSWEQFHITPSQDPQYASFYRIPEGPPIDVPDGHWVHIPFSLNFHTYPSPGSNFFAYMAATVLGVGIEHVPEPVSVALLGMGVACASIGAYSRRRRHSQP
ncbi:MAG: PEP-CTERM sorting domain-containing protein [Pirellulales bacterium]